MSDDRIQVGIRIRPRLSKFDEQFAAKCCSRTDCDDATEDAILNMAHPSDESFRHRPQAFKFNFVWDEDDSQLDLYDGACSGLVDSCLLGHPATILAYGQTGSGKTHTILGDIDARHGTVIPGSGIFPRVIDELFRFKRGSPNHVVLILSILEIYNDTIRDLLGGGKSIHLRILGADDAVPLGLTRAQCDTLQQAVHHFQDATSLRKVAFTQMNDVSSRSHACFLVDVFQQTRTADNPDPPDVMALLRSEESKRPDAEAGEATSELADDFRFPILRSRLSLIDLAGSERLKRSMADGANLKETQAINTSLSCLGTVVSALHRGEKYVSYRDSKLTLLLKASFANPYAKILMITNLSPTENSFQESLVSVRFADRVKAIKVDTTNVSVSTVHPSVEMDYLQLLKDFSLLAADVRIAMAGGYVRQIHGRRPWNASQLSSSLAATLQQQKATELQKRVHCCATRRSIIEPRERLMIKIEEVELQGEEIDLLERTAVFELEMRQLAVQHLSEHRDKIRELRTVCEAELGTHIQRDRQQQRVDTIAATLSRFHELLNLERKHLLRMWKRMWGCEEDGEEGEEDGDDGDEVAVKVDGRDLLPVALYDAFADLVDTEMCEASSVGRRPPPPPPSCPSCPPPPHPCSHCTSPSVVSVVPFEFPNCNDVTAIIHFDTTKVQEALYNSMPGDDDLPTPYTPPIAFASTSGDLLRMPPTPPTDPSMDIARSDGFASVIPALSSPFPDACPADVRTFIGHLAKVYCTAVSHDGTLLASASGDRTVKIWDIKTGDVLHTLIGHTSTVFACCFSPLDHQVISASDDHSVKKWDALSGQKLFSMLGHSDSVFRCVYSPVGREVASASNDKTIRVWNAKNGRRLCVLRGHTKAVFSVCFSLDGTKIVSAGNDKMLRVWNWAKKQQLFSLEEHSFSVSFSPMDDRVLLSSSRDMTIKVLKRDHPRGMHVKSFAGHSGTTYHAAWALDGRFIVSCSGDRTLKLWDTEGGQAFATLHGHNNSVYHCTVFSHMVVSCSGDVIKLWDMSDILKQHRNINLPPVHSNPF
eukprot:NODE_21_length_3354_cov_202.002421_g17_i0.p1 GENE.NODE_21_length_3354_cov_202.002421_g17_i0~~NODE_21_length_3354_cov_202.002421_g17_i0.p1  ORF type:complete len:1047 (+),score=235.92 NODE_21_length_3354_cov_202.002421_g17_i0:125-3265(+)